MSHLDPILWYVLHIKLMAEVTTWDIYLFQGYKSGSVGLYHIQVIIFRTIHH